MEYPAHGGDPRRLDYTTANANHNAGGPVLHHRISNLSDAGGSQTVRGRPSLVSLPSLPSLQMPYDPYHPPPPLPTQYIPQQSYYASAPPLPTQVPFQVPIQVSTQIPYQVPAPAPVQTTPAQTITGPQLVPVYAPSYVGGQALPSFPPSTMSGWAANPALTSYVGNGGLGISGASDGTHQPVQYSTPVAPAPLSSQTQAHQQAPPQAGSSHRSFARRSMAARRSHQYQVIPEEGDGIHMAALPPHPRRQMSGQSEQAPILATPPAAVVEPDPEAMTLDLSTIGGLRPWTTQDDAEMVNSLQQQEARGQLTGGLGEGFRNSTTVREADLLASPPSPTETRQLRSLSLSSRRRSRLGRQATVRARAQDEADRLGEIVEVIMDVDISDLRGSATTGSPQADPHQKTLDDHIQPIMQRSTFPQKEQVKQVFYPQPNWKPFSMRGPYLMLLIVLSVVLAIAQELLYRTSMNRPLVEFHAPKDIPGHMYFAIKFAPTLVAVSFGVLWQITDFEVRRLEAFYQLSKDGGALAAESINVDYITYFSFFRPVRALRCRHYAVFLSSMASLLAISLVPTLSAASLKLSPDRNERIQDPLGLKFITIDPVWSRLLTTTLSVIALLGCVLFWQLQTRKSGLLSDVKGIAGLASMAVVSHILNDFKDMDTVTHQEIHRQVKDNRYMLLNSALAPDDTNRPVSTLEAERYRESGLSQNPHPLMLRAAGAVPLIVGILIFLALLYTTLFTAADALTDKAPWFITLFAVCVKMGFSGLESDLKMMEPYYILWRRHAPAKTLTLDYTAMPFGWVAIRGLLNRHPLVFFVGFGSVMSEILTILSTSLATVSGRDFTDQISRQQAAASRPQNSTNQLEDNKMISAGQETETSFWITLGLTTFILLYMAATATAVFRLRRRPFLPRQPNTIASVLAFIHQSKMLYDFVGTSKLNSTAMARKLDEVGDTYGVGWFKGRDGLPHCGVDREELLSDYKVGYNYNMATKPWLSQDYY